MNNLQSITPTQAWHLLQKHTDAQLIDVRTEPEWAFVGLPDLTMVSRKPILLPWRLYPGMDLNPSFVELLEQKVPNRQTHLMFLCRTGGRSAEAAATMLQYGYMYCYNVVGGFEGDCDKAGHRGTVTGWKTENLPWRQN